jgi:hypothetical protein
LLWLGLLLFFLLLGTGYALLFGSESLHQPPSKFWQFYLSMPLLVWCLLGCGRLLLHIGQLSVADAWDKARQEDVDNKLRQGRRSQQVLGVSLYTGLREVGQQPAIQLDAFLGGVSALRIQPSRIAEGAVLQSCLPVDTHEDPEYIIQRVMASVLADMTKILAALPDNQPVALLLELDSGLPQSRLCQIWQKAWNESGIRQKAVPVDGVGLAALDDWLDQRAADPAMLLVVALQFAQPQAEGTAEVAVGLLLGNRLTQATLPPLAYLHRPEEERGQTSEHLRYAVRQALDWVPLQASAIKQVWGTGYTARRGSAIAPVLAEVAIPGQHTKAFCDLNGLLGHPGQAAPWLAIAAATQNIQRSAGAQFIFSGGISADAGLWCTVVAPVT